MTRIGRPSCTAAPTTPCPTCSRSVGVISSGITDRVGDAQRLLAFVEQVDRKRAEARQAGDELGNPREQLLQIEHRHDVPAEVEERGQQFGVGWRTNGARRGLTHRLESFGLY